MQDGDKAGKTLGFGLRVFSPPNTSKPSPSSVLRTVKP